MSTERMRTRFRRKAVIYATWGDRLLVFTEPDHPEAGTQVPGGTIEPGETVTDGARREFVEETGFEAPLTLTLLGESTHIYVADGVRHEHERSYVHMRLNGDYPERWEWTEQWPDGGDAPIRMAFFFLPLAEVPELFGGLGAFLPAARALATTEALR